MLLNWLKNLEQTRQDYESFDGFWLRRVPVFYNLGLEPLSVQTLHFMASVFTANFINKQPISEEDKWAFMNNNYSFFTGDRLQREESVERVKYLQAQSTPEEYQAYQVWVKSRSGNTWAELGTEIGRIGTLAAVVVGAVVAAPALSGAASSAGGAAPAVGGGFTLPTLPAGVGAAIPTIGSLGDELKKRAEVELKKLGQKQDETEAASNVIQVSASEIVKPVASKALLFLPLLLLL